MPGASRGPLRQVSKSTTVLVKTYDAETGCKCFNQYRVLEEIGRGSFGKVKVCVDERDRYFAVKICRRPSTKVHFGSVSRAFTAGFKNEVEIWKTLDHENIVRLHEVVDSAADSKVYLVMEYLSAGPVRFADDKENPLLTQDQARYYFRDVITGLQYLHKNGIIHRDIKPENLLVSGDGIIKICDFGSAQYVHDQHQHRRTLGSPAFFAPELCQDETAEVTTGVDMWAAGICLYVFVFGHMPFFALSIAELHRQIVNNHITFPWETNPQLEDLIKGCLAKDPEKRMSAQQVLAHPWMVEKPERRLSLISKRN
eukprot:Ihof_evm4s279 gene=Ihof_evmTU4s279